MDMPRLKKERCTTSVPGCQGFMPKGISCKGLEKIMIAPDEYEAIKLADYEGLTMKEAALRMDISAPTFCRILASAHKKLADAFIHNKGICFLP